jgi:hypothetical protein
LKKVKKHDCRRNWSASSKAMESDMGVELVKLSEGKEFELGDVINDGDSTLMANINEKVKRKVNNWKDMHTSRSLTNSLYQLQKVH